MQRLRRPRSPFEAKAYLAARSVPSGECRVFVLAHNGDGYCQTHYRGELVLVHRLAYEIHVGPIPTGMTIDHVCGRRNCIEPSHLRAVTIQENIARRRERDPDAPPQSRYRGPSEAHRQATRRWRAKKAAQARERIPAGAAS